MMQRHELSLVGNSIRLFWWILLCQGPSTICFVASEVWLNKDSFPINSRPLYESDAETKVRIQSPFHNLIVKPYIWCGGTCLGQVLFRSQPATAQWMYCLQIPDAVFVKISRVHLTTAYVDQKQPASYYLHVIFTYSMCRLVCFCRPFWNRLFFQSGPCINTRLLSKDFLITMLHCYTFKIFVFV